MVPEQLPVRLERKPFLPPPKVVRFICVHFVSNWTKSPPTYARAEDSYLDWLGRLVPLRDREMWLMIEVYRAALSLSVTERCGSWSKFTGCLFWWWSYHLIRRFLWWSSIFWVLSQSWLGSCSQQWLWCHHWLDGCCRQPHARPQPWCLLSKTILLLLQLALGVVPLLANTTSVWNSPYVLTRLMMSTWVI